MSIERRKENKFIVYTDIVGHTKMFGRVGAAFRAMRERHDELFTSAARQHAPNAVVKGTGDGFYAAMDDVAAAVETALAFRRALATEDWDKLLPPEKRTPENHIKARVGIHSGLVNVSYDDLKAVDFDGQPRSITDKVMSMAVGNQVLATRQVRDQGQVNLSRRDEMEWKKFGEYKLRDVVDTVEIWGLGEGELGIGPKPAQPPEHRVVVFATIHDYSTVVEAAGPNYDALKDKWDSAFDAAVAAHAKDTFVKRLPDGSLAAFKNAMDAVRASRDFRRAMKVAMKNEALQLQPKVALDSGLVTFDYEANRAVDVRDQPVNIAAKVCKTGLSAAWQLILSRPVREDAFQNLPEREEYKWVCIGRKAVPGEPEPVELWDFQDIQSKSETRTVMWVDAKNVHDALRVLPHIYARFAARLEDLVREMITRRTEEPWILTTEHGVAAAFKDPVEAVAGAIDLRDAATKEEWERFLTGFSRGSRTDNLIRIAVHQGPMRITFEDGQLKEFKGAAVDGIKPVVEAAKNSQILLSRELKETVGTAFPASEVKWRKIDLTVKDPTHPNEAFELRKVKKIPKPVLVGSAVGAALVIVLLIGLVFMKPGEDPQIKGMGNVATIIAQARARGIGLSEIAAKYQELIKKRDDGLKAEGRSDVDRVKALEQEAEFLKGITEQWDAIDAVQLAGEERAALAALGNLGDFRAWWDKAQRAHAAVKDDPRMAAAPAWQETIRRLRLELLGASLSTSEWNKKVGDAEARVDALLKRRITGADAEAIKKEVAEISDLLAEGGDLRKGIALAVAERRKSFSAEEAAAAKQAEEEANRLAAQGELPVEALTVILRAQKSGAESLRAIGAAADRAKLALVRATPGQKPEERGKQFEPLAAAMRAILDDQQTIDFVSLAQDWKADGTLERLAKSQGIDEIKSLLSGVDGYRPAAGEDPRRSENWTAALRGFRTSLSAEGASDAEADQQMAALEARIRAIGELTFIQRNAERLAAESRAIADALRPDGDLGKRVAAAVAAVRDKAMQGEAALRARREAQQRFAQAVAPVSVGAGSPAADRAWLNASAAFKQKRTDDNAGALAGEVEAVYAALKAAPAAFAAAPRLDGTPWERDLGPVVDRLREDAVAQALGKLDWKSGVKPEAVAAAAAEGGAAFKRLAEGIERAAEDGKSLGEALGSGSGPGQAAPGRKETVQQVAEALKASPALEAAGVRSIFAPLLARFDALAGVGASTSADALVEAATRGGASDEVISTAWRRLGEIAPTGEARWLGQQVQVYDALRRSGVPAAAKERAGGERAARWVAHVEALKGSGLEDALPAAYARRAEFGVGDAQVAGMSWRSRYNLALARIQAGLNEGAGEDELKAAVKAALDLEAGMPAGPDGATRTFAVLRGLGAGSVGGGEQALPLDQAGPAAMKDLFVFKAGGGDDAPTYELRPVPGKGGYEAGLVRGVQTEFRSTTLAFRRVIPKGGETAGKPVYMSTTEVSAGVAIELLRRDPGKITTSLFSDATDGFPRVWSYNDNKRDLRIAAASAKTPANKLLLSWVTESEKVEDPEQYYPEAWRGGKVAPPSPDHPMQMVSVVAAAYVARLAGCRLPTSDEWRAALEMEGDWRTAATWNLRGAGIDDTRAFRRQRRNGPPAWQNEPAFFRDWQGPQGQKGAATTVDDGTLWMDKVGESRAAVFAHLVGNVGEWVFDRPTAMSAVGASGIKSFLDDEALRNHAGVIGGSYASSAGLAGDRLDDSVAAMSKLQGGLLRIGKERGFADIGFRLAFTPSVVRTEETGVSYTGEVAEARKQFVYLPAP